MSASRILRVLNANILQKSNVICTLKRCSVAPDQVNVIPLRTFKSTVPLSGLRKDFARFERIMNVRRKLAGPERIRKRSEWLDWDYTAELYAFPKRLHENLSEETLRSVFTHQSYIDEEERKRQALGVPIQDVPIKLSVNTSLITLGENIMVPYIKGFIRHCYNELPEDGVMAVFAYLTSENMLSHVSANIGTRDLILTAEFPIEDSTLASTLKAFIGGIATDESQEHAEFFILDFICLQLVGQDIMEIWDIPNPLQVLDELLKRHGRAPPESRLVFETGRNTIEALYVVGLYSDKEFLAKAPGETVVAAEEVAAINALRKFFKLNLNEKPIPLGKKGRDLKLHTDTEHSYLSEWCNRAFVTKKLEAS